MTHCAPHDLVNVRQDFLNRFEMQPVAGDIPGFFVFSQDAEEASGFALGQEDTLFLVTLGFAEEFLGFAAGLGQDVGLVAARLVDEFFPVSRARTTSWKASRT